MAAYCQVDGLVTCRLAVHRDQLWAQCSVMSIGKLPFLPVGEYELDVYTIDDACLRWNSICVLLQVDRGTGKFAGQRPTFYHCNATNWHLDFSAIYISRLCYDVSVRLSVHLSVTEVHWRIIANLVFKFRSQFTATCGHGACGRGGRDHHREEWRDHLALC